MPIDTKKANKRHTIWVNEKRDRINLLFSKGLKEQIQDAAKSAGLSQSQWVEQAIREKMDRDAEMQEKIK